MSVEKFEPTDQNLGKECAYWNVGHVGVMLCFYPKAEIINRRSCEGLIDDVCLFLKDGQPAGSLSREQAVELKTHSPNPKNKSYIPPGNTHRFKISTT